MSENLCTSPQTSRRQTQVTLRPTVRIESQERRGHSIITERAISAAPTPCSNFHRRDKRCEILAACSSDDSVLCSFSDKITPPREISVRTNSGLQGVERQIQ